MKIVPEDSIYYKYYKSTLVLVMAWCQAIKWNNDDHVAWCHKESLEHSELIQVASWSIWIKKHYACKSRQSDGDTDISH